jgi:hypothetical protein
MTLDANDRLSISCAVEARWFLDGDVGADLLRGVDHPKKRVDSYHLDSLTETTAVKRRGQRGRFEEKWRVGAPTEFVFGDVVGHVESWRKRRLDKNPHPRGEWTDVHKRIWTGRGWEIARLDVRGRRGWTVALSLPWDGWRDDAAAVLAPWWPTLGDEAVAASYPAWLMTFSEELVDLGRRAG